nr:MAG: RdRp [Plasmopara viticola lesion associated narnavirus 45]
MVVYPPKISSHVKWDTSKHSLTTRSFPATCVLRASGGSGTCTCGDGVIHRDYFSFAEQVLMPQMKSEAIIPAVKVCWNAENLWESNLPRKLTGLNKRLVFDELPLVWHAQKVLFEGTYWFKRLLLDLDGERKHTRNGVAVLRMIAGKSSFTGRERVDELVRLPVRKEGVQRLRQVLATVDGLVMQLVMCFPGFYKSWDVIDQVIHCLICQLLPDYFRGEESIDRLSTFEKVKKLRKAIKMEGFMPNGSLVNVVVPRELSFFKVILDFIGGTKTPFSMLQVSILGQTRASGVPPRSVYFKTLLKIKAILQEPPDPSVYERIKGHIARGVDALHDAVLECAGSETNTERFFRSCLDKAKISLSDSGEFFTNSNSGGKLEACRQILQDNPVVEEVDLYTGKLTGNLLTKDTHSAGELIFHYACGLFRDRKHCYEKNLMSVRISLVAELGKYRGITVSHLCHAVLLHVLSHVLLEYIKIIPSSESGVGAANHAWNFFKRLSHKNPNANFLFGDKEVYLFSTDWEQATDFCDHKVSHAMINRICYNLGIPDWYRETCCFALCAPRQVEFINEDKILDRFYTSRGELMGDPVVKVILHAYHLVSRFASLEAVHRGRSRC